MSDTSSTQERGRVMPENYMSQRHFPDVATNLEAAAIEHDDLIKERDQLQRNLEETVRALRALFGWAREFFHGNPAPVEHTRLFLKRVDKNWPGITDEHLVGDLPRGELPDGGSNV